ncbi:MAG: Ig domain-containing protein, partial [Prevotella sp.]|nr:Ig domain-containing protein [Prevotella sp.]
MKTYRFVFLFAMLSVLPFTARAADVTTVINAQININGEVISWEPRERSNLLYGSFTVVAYVNGVECGASSYSDANEGNPDYPPSYYYPVIVTTDAANIGKTIEMHLVVTAPDESDDEYGFWYGSEFANISNGEYVIQDISYSTELTVKDGEYGSAEEESFVTLNFVSPTEVTLPETIKVKVNETVDLLSLLSYSPQNASIPLDPSITWDFGNSAEFINVVDNKLIGLADTGARGAYLGGSFTNGSLSMWTIVSVIDPDVCTVYASLYRDGSEYVKLSFDQDTKTSPVLSAYVNGQRVAGPVSFQRDFSQQMGGYFLLKLKDAPEGNIEFRVSNYSFGVYSSSELIVQSASLMDVTGASFMTTFPFKKGETYGSSYNTVKVEMVTPKQVALSPSEISVPVGIPVSIKNTFEVSFLSDTGGPASIPSAYTATWNVGNYVREFTINGDEMTPQTLFPDPVVVNVDITNEDFNLQLSGRVSVTVKELLTGISFAEHYQNVKRGGDVNIYYSPIPESATYPDVMWEYDKKAFMIGNDPTGAPIMKVTENAPYGDYEIVAIALDENGEETDISDTIFVTVCAPVERIDVSTKGLLMTVGQTIALSDYVKVLPEEACDREFYVMLEKQGNGILMEGEDEEGNPVITAVELGGPLTVTVVAADNREVTAQFPVAVVTPLTGLAFQEPMQYRRPGEGVNTALTPIPRDASGYITTLEYDKNVFEQKSADAGLSVKANAPYGTYEVVASAEDIFGNDLKISSKLEVIICAPVSEIQVVSPITMALNEERALSSLVTVLPEEACDKEYGVQVSSDGNSQVVSVDSEDEEGDIIIEAVGYGKATLTVFSFDNQSITAKIEVTVADVLTSISFANRRQQGYPGTVINSEWSYSSANAIQPEVRFEYDKTVFEEQATPAGAPTFVVKEVAPAGEYKIVGKAYYDEVYQNISDTIYVSVWAHVTDIETTPLNMTVGDVVELAPYINIEPSNAHNKEYNVRSSNEDIVRVVPTLNNQRVSYTAVAVAEGSTTLKVISNDQSIEKELQVTVAAKVIPVADIAIAKGHESHTLWVGERLDLTPSLYIISPQDATNQNVEWSSSDATIVKITSEATNNGVTAVALKAGTATLTVKTVDGGKTATISVTVWSHVESVTLTEQSLSLTKGQSAVLDGYVKVSPEDAHDRAVRWTTSDKGVATVSEGNGQWSVTAVGDGE